MKRISEKVVSPKKIELIEEDIPSLAGQYGGPRTPSYCAVKAAVQAI